MNDEMQEMFYDDADPQWENTVEIIRPPVVEDDDAPDVDWDAHMFDMAIRQK